MTQQLTTLYELYKSLPEKDRYKFKKIIVNEPETVQVKAKKESPYSPEFEAKIKQSDKDFANGNYQVIETSDLWK
jgi:hypothetical protein